ncbi:YSIRK-type signal peptide-containing protein [Staphylococcus carnosus]|uniref:YSIRK-type signal peptide-containing protein n=1 Tax=Staphylococcus carnosus TaxID=1281 RepID=UPI000CD195CC|nr:YSIRK-type signal peptide-containing protein [Staphylococcus carnosus]POA01273.1 hypothetical protein CD153_08150 [Staphylococcus carnosus]QRQ04111.1 YSIRK-type signal peptide-containing protein [Staphylococcus carnosus]UTB83889.1 hypothetical protein A2I67_11765 [Staphylococcus carnosus]SUM04858.1 triacylglycerol lipase [Staphylococcus carnosus]GEP79622.1 hypothetical protein SCA05_14150 [Staphylococcus carnosus]
MENNDFFKSRKNRYSIPKMTAGAASIIVGITLFGNAHAAQAAEQTDNGDTKAQTSTQTMADSTKQTVGNNSSATSENTNLVEQNTNVTSQNSSNDTTAQSQLDKY